MNANDKQRLQISMQPQLHMSSMTQQASQQIQAPLTPSQQLPPPPLQPTQSALTKEASEQLAIIKKELRSLPHLEIIEKVGQGSFGDIFKAWDSKRGRWAAIKFEKKDKKTKYSLLKKEAQIMQQVKGSQYFPMLFDSRFTDISIYSFLEMSFLGPNLESLKKGMQETRFSLRTVLLIAIQMISGLQVLHDKGIVHRDIKPENFVIGSDGQHHQVFVIDFGLSKYYLEENGQHIEQLQNKGLVGTARYTSINSHLGVEQSRRDDLESVAYLLMYFARGTLIWQNLSVKDKEQRFRKIAELKQITPHETMCRGLPKQFLEFLNLVKSLGFTQKPEYDRYRTLFIECFQANFKTPYTQACFDWCPRQCVLAPIPIRKSATGNLSNSNSNASRIQQQQQHQSQLLLQQALMPQANDEGNNSTNYNQRFSLSNSNAITANNLKKPADSKIISSSSKKVPVQQQQHVAQRSHDLFDLLNFPPRQIEHQQQQIDLDSVEEIAVSEYENGQIQRPKVPVFLTENNYLTNHHYRHHHNPMSRQSMPAAFNLVQSESAGGELKTKRFQQMSTQQQSQIAESLPPVLHQTQSVNFLGQVSPFNNNNNNNNNNNHLHNIAQPHLSAVFQVIQKESSQFVNNWSNEWNSEFDEKVEAKPVISSNAVISRAQ